MIPFFPQSNRPWWRPGIGWVTPALPYTGTMPRRMYLRCSVWPGPPGMVPTFANQPQVPGFPPGPGIPGPMGPGGPMMPGGPMGPGGGRRRRRGHRRR